MVAGDMHILFHVEHECAEYCGKVVKRTPQIILIYRARIISELIKRKGEGPQIIMIIMIYSDYLTSLDWRTSLSPSVVYRNWFELKNKHY